MFDLAKISTLPTRDRLVMTAAGLLLRQSFGAVSVDDICRAAEVKKGTFYHHFASKVDLALAAYDFMWTDFKAKLDACFDEVKPPLQRLADYAGGAYACHKELFDREGKIYGCPLATAGHEMGAQDEKIRAALKTHFDGHCGYFERVAEDLGLAGEASAALGREMFSYAMGVFYQAKVANDPEVIQRDLFAGLKRLSGADTIRSVKYA